LLVQVWVGSRHENYEVNPRVRAALAGCTFHVAQSRARAACCHFRRSGPESRAGQPSRACGMCPFVRACVRCAHAVSRARQCCAGVIRCARHARAKADAAASPHGACVCRRSCRTTLCARWTTTPRTGAMAPPSPSARPVPVAAWSRARLRPARPTAGTRALARALTHTRPIGPPRLCRSSAAVARSILRQRCAPAPRQMCGRLIPQQTRPRGPWRAFTSRGAVPAWQPWVATAGDADFGDVPWRGRSLGRRPRVSDVQAMPRASHTHAARSRQQPPLQRATATCRAALADLPHRSASC
jgi:hypothetical protein